MGGGGAGAVVGGSGAGTSVDVGGGGGLIVDETVCAAVACPCGAGRDVVAVR